MRLKPGLTYNDLGFPRLSNEHQKQKQSDLSKRIWSIFNFVAISVLDFWMLFFFNKPDSSYESEHRSFRWTMAWFGSGLCYGKFLRIKANLHAWNFATYCINRKNAGITRKFWVPREHQNPRTGRKQISFANPRSWKKGYLKLLIQERD